jgi:hypothetical protein
MDDRDSALTLLWLKNLNDVCESSGEPPEQAAASQTILPQDGGAGVFSSERASERANERECHAALREEKVQDKVGISASDRSFVIGPVTLTGESIVHSHDFGYVL